MTMQMSIHTLNRIIFNTEDASTSIFAFYGLLLSLRIFFAIKSYLDITHNKHDLTLCRSALDLRETYVYCTLFLIKMKKLSIIIYDILCDQRGN